MESFEQRNDVICLQVLERIILLTAVKEQTEGGQG